MNRARILLALCALSFGACAALVAQFGFGPPQRRIIVPHDTHKKAEIDCSTCHEKVYEAKSLSESSMPKEKLCLSCHKEDKEAGKCGMCHSDPDHPVTYSRQSPHLIMSHEKHIERVNEDCSKCHERLPSPSVTGAPSVDMKVCTACHEHQAQFDAGRCEVCHDSLTRYPIKPLVGSYKHRGDFLKTHSGPARASTESCATCHEQTFCTDCHSASIPTRPEVIWSERVDRRFIHRADFISRHAIEASADNVLCARCHGTSFCEACHTAQNLTVDSATPRYPHPGDWIAYGSRTGHGPVARQDITRCGACHDGERSICIDCHRSGGVGGNPHPPGWTSRHPATDIPRDPLCRACHQ